MIIDHVLAPNATSRVIVILCELIMARLPIPESTM